MQPLKLSNAVESRFEKLRLRDPVFAAEVGQEAALMAVEKGSPVITDSIASSAQRRLRETAARHGGQPSRRQRARDEQFCNRSPMEFKDEKSGDIFSIFDALLPSIDTPLAPLRSRGISIFNLDAAKLSTEAQVLLQMLVEHADQMHQIETNAKLTKRQCNQKIQGIQRKFAFAISRIAPAVKAELEGALELEREAAGMGRLSKRSVNNTENANSLVRRTDPKLKTDNEPYNAFKRWGLDKKRVSAQFWADVFAGKLTGPDGFIMHPGPIKPDHPLVVRRYTKLGLPVDYVPVHRLTDEQRLEDAESWGAYVGAMDALTVEEESAWNMTQPAWRLAHGIELQETLQ